MKRIEKLYKVTLSENSVGGSGEEFDEVVYVEETDIPIVQKVVRTKPIAVHANRTNICEPAKWEVSPSLGINDLLPMLFQFAI